MLCPDFMFILQDIKLVNCPKEIMQLASIIIIKTKNYPSTLWACLFAIQVYSSSSMQVLITPFNQPSPPVLFF
jgi:hypothetical protein